MKKYFLQILIALSQLGNSILGGYADETMSSRAYRTEQKGKFFGKFFRPIIDWLFETLFNDAFHCENSYVSEKLMRQVHPEIRESINGQ
jgi:hypothetical protein